MRPVFTAVAIGLLAVLTTACSTGRISSVWTNPTVTSTRYHKLLVFGVTDSPTVRRAYEDNFVRRLRALGVKAIAGHTLVSDSNLSLVVRLTETIPKAGADGVIITHLISAPAEGGPQPLRAAKVPGYYRNLVPYFSQVYQDVCGPGYYANLKALRLETNLYDAKHETLVWSGRSQRLDPSSEKTTISDVIDEVIEQMALDGYLPWASAGPG